MDDEEIKLLPKSAFKEFFRLTMVRYKALDQTDKSIVKSLIEYFPSEFDPTFLTEYKVLNDNPETSLSIDSPVPTKMLRVHNNPVTVRTRMLRRHNMSK